MIDICFIISLIFVPARGRFLGSIVPHSDQDCSHGIRPIAEGMALGRRHRRLKPDRNLVPPPDLYRRKRFVRTESLPPIKYADPASAVVVEYGRAVGIGDLIVHLSVAGSYASTVSNVRPSDPIPPKRIEDAVYSAYGESIAGRRHWGLCRPAVSHGIVSLNHVKSTYKRVIPPAA